MVPKILRSAPQLKHLQDADINHIAEFAQGFAQIAFLTAEAGTGLNYNALNQGKLADRLLWGRSQPNESAREIIRALSLFTSVGRSGAATQQLAFVRNELCGGMSEYDFNRLTRPFRDMRIIQSAGDYIMVSPLPLAVALAAEWLDDAPEEQVLRLLPDIEANGLTKAFCDQISRLDFSEKATALSKRLMDPGGPLSSAEVLNSKVGSQLFRALSELNPPAATDCLYRLFVNAMPETARNIKAGRRDLVWALEKLCWSSETFDKAATVLLLFAAGENEKWSNNATGHFQQLFHIYLSGTRQPAIDRLRVVERGLQSSSAEVRMVCIRALGAALEYSSFVRSFGAEVRGTRLPEKDWEPSTGKDVSDYWRQAFALLRDASLRADETSKVAVDTLGERLAAILTCPLARELEGDFRDIANSQQNLWPAARETILRTLEYNKDLSEDLRQTAQRCLQYVQPRDLQHRLKDTVSTPGWHHETDAEGNFVDISKRNAAALADELHSAGIDIVPFLPHLLEGEQQQGWTFGARWAELSGHSKLLLNRCLAVLRQVHNEKRNVQLVRGVLSTVNDDRLIAEFLDQVAADEDTRALLVPLSTAAARSIDVFDRVARELESGRISADSLRLFAYGSVTRELPDERFRQRLEELVGCVPDAAPPVLEIVELHCHMNAAKWKTFRPLIEKLVVMPEVLSMARDVHYWQDNTKRLLSQNPSTAWIRALARALIEEQTSKRTNLYMRESFGDVLATLLANYSKVVWPVFEQALKASDNTGRFYLIELLGGGGVRFRDSASPLWNLPPDEFRRWIESNKELIPSVLHFMPAYTTEKAKDGTETLRWHPYTLELVRAGEAESVARGVVANLLSFGSTGSRVPYLRKRVALAQELLQDKDRKVVTAGEALMAAIRAEEEHELKRDAEHAAGIY